MTGAADRLPDFRFYAPRAGHPDLAACHAEALELAGRILPVIKKDADASLGDRLADARRKASALLRTAENFRINRRRFRAGDHAFRPLYTIWTTTNACNFRCTYCDDHQGRHYYDLPTAGELDTEQGKRLLEVMLTGSPAIYWCGGEPTLRRDLPELLDHAWRLGFFPNMINTNGALFHTLLAKPEWKDFLWRMDLVVTSLDGLDVGLLNGLWGTQRARQVVVNLLLLRALRSRVRFKLAVNTVITPETIDEARSVLDLACDLGVWFVPVPVNHGHRPEQRLLDDPRYRALADLILERKRRGHRIIGSERLLRNLLTCAPYRCYTTLKPHVWPDGAVCWPCRAATHVRPVDIRLLDHDSFDAAYRAGRERINPDDFHGTAAHQCGGDCAWMQNYTTARYMDGIADPLGGGFLAELHEFALNRKNW